MVRFSCVQWQCRLCSSWCSPSSTQSGGHDAGCQLPPRFHHGGTHRSTLNAAEAGQPVSWGLTQSCLCEGQSGEPDAEPSHMSKTGHGGIHRSVFDAASLGDPWVSTWPAWAAPSQGNLTLGDSSHRESTMGEPIVRRSIRPDQEDRCQGGLVINLASLSSSTQSGEADARCQLSPRVDHGGTHRSTLSPASLRVWRSGSELPSYGGTHQERHLHAVRLERRSGVTRIFVPAELPRLGPLSVLIYCPRRVEVAERAVRRSVRVLT